jgi:hypothetical protein
VADSNNAGAIRLCWRYFGEGHRRRRATFKSLPITRRRRNQTGCGYGLFPGDVLPCVYSAIGDLTSAIPCWSRVHPRVSDSSSQKLGDSRWAGTGFFTAPYLGMMIACTIWNLNELNRTGLWMSIELPPSCRVVGGVVMTDVAEQHAVVKFSASPHEIRRA